MQRQQRGGNNMKVTIISSWSSWWLNSDYSTAKSIKIIFRRQGNIPSGRQQHYNFSFVSPALCILSTMRLLWNAIGNSCWLAAGSVIRLRKSSEWTDWAHSSASTLFYRPAATAADRERGWEVKEEEQQRKELTWVQGSFAGFYTFTCCDWEVMKNICNNIGRKFPPTIATK